MDQKPSIGRIVHYVLAASDEVLPQAVGEHRPAVIVRVWPGEFGDAECPDGINAQVFLDGTNDVETNDGSIAVAMWTTSVPYSSEPKPGTWHWPERV